MEDINATPGALVPAEVIPIDQLIVVRQLPVIEEHLRTVKADVTERVDAACSLVCNADNLQTVKAARAELRKVFESLEAQRKQVKAAVLAPYERFLDTYEDCVSLQFKRADATLKAKIDAVTSALKTECEEGLREYFAELCEAYHVDFLEFKQAGVKVDLTSATAKTPTKLRGQLAEFVTNVACDIRLIEKMDDAREIMVEYKRTLSVAQAVSAVQERHRLIEAEKAAAEIRQAAAEQEEKAAERVHSFAPPVEMEQPKQYRVTFTVTDTKDRLRLLKQFLEANGYQYE